MKGQHKNWLRPQAVLDLALAAALAATLAHWTWALAAPAAVAAPAYAAPAAPAAADAARLRGLFGAPRAAPPAAAGPLRLVGVVAPGQAVFALQGGKPRAARPGEEIAPGTILREVHRDHVVVERNGAVERLGFERDARR